MQSPAELQAMPSYNHLIGEVCPTSRAASEEMAECMLPSHQAQEGGRGWGGRKKGKGCSPVQAFPSVDSLLRVKKSQAMLEDELPSTCFQQRQGQKVIGNQWQGSCNSSTKCKIGLAAVVNKIRSFSLF